MRQILIAQGMDLCKARDVLEEHNINDAWIVLANSDLALWEFLRELHDSAGMANAVLSRLRACKSFDWRQAEVVLVSENEKVATPRDLVELLKIVRRDENASLLFICANRTLRANLMQQLLYLGLSLDRYIFALHCDGLGSQAVKLAKKCALSRWLIGDTHCDARSREMLLALLGRLERELRSGVLKLALIASKKSGKSTLLNGLLGEHLTPAGSELASPNSISYHRNRHGKYKLAHGDRIVFAESGRALRRLLQTKFTEAQYNASGGFCLENMEIEYGGRRSLLPDWILVDTPGADAAGTAHGKAASQSLKECDAALFLIDYQKYLTESETELLCEARNALSADNLYLALNKLDMGLQDSGAKSWIASVDFIRSRLIALDERFAEHFIQPLSARLYSNLLLLRNAVPEFGYLQRLYADGSDILESLPELRRELRDILPDEVRSALANLAADASRIADAYGFETLTASQLEHFSGVPRLAHLLLQSRVACESKLPPMAREMASHLRDLSQSPLLPLSVRKCLEPFA